MSSLKYCCGDTKPEDKVCFLPSSPHNITIITTTSIININININSNSNINFNISTSTPRPRGHRQPDDDHYEVGYLVR